MQTSAAVDCVSDDRVVRLRNADESSWDTGVLVAGSWQEPVYLVLTFVA